MVCFKQVLNRISNTGISRVYTVYRNIHFYSCTIERWVTFNSVLSRSGDSSWLSQSTQFPSGLPWGHNSTLAKLNESLFIHFFLKRSNNSTFRTSKFWNTRILNLNPNWRINVNDLLDSPMMTHHKWLMRNLPESNLGARYALDFKISNKLSVSGESFNKYFLIKSE